MTNNERVQSAATCRLPRNSIPTPSRTLQPSDHMSKGRLSMESPVRRVRYPCYDWTVRSRSGTGIAPEFMTKASCCASPLVRSPEISPFPSNDEKEDWVGWIRGAE